MRCFKRKKSTFAKTLNFKNMLKEFKTFVMRGNVVDLAVAVIIGAAFGAIVSSLVADVITPLLLKPAMTSLGVDKLEGLSWNGVLYGKFLATVINFLVVAFVIFIMIKGMNTALKKKKQEEENTPAPPAGPTQEELLAEIRDLLKNK
jgi:large conductance mechanosensitive channel